MSPAPEPTLLDPEDRKALAKALVHDDLAAASEEEAADLPLAFDTVYRSAERRLDGAVRTSEAPEGLPFDASFLAGSALTSAVWIACSLIRAHRLRMAPDRAEGLSRRLAEQVGSQPRVERMKGRVDVLVPTLEDMTRQLDEREEAVRGRHREVERKDPGTRRSGGATVPSAPGIDHLQDSPTDLTIIAARRGPIAETYLFSYRLLGRGPDGNPLHLRCPPCILHRDPVPGIAESLARGRDGRGALHVDQLGHFLGQKLLPAKLVHRLRGMLGGSASLQVMPEAPAVPWEILRLATEKDGEAAASPYLADAFALSQWPTEGGPAMHLTARNIAVVAAGDCRLSAIAREVRFLESLAGPQRSVQRLPASYDAVVSALTGGVFDVLHFAGHGVAPGDDPDRWSLVLDGGETFSPIDLSGRAAGLRSRRPLVFLNACHTGRDGWSLTGIGGLAASFLDAGAGAVIGTHWAVQDSAACAFAKSFYPHYLAGIPIAEAVWRARRQVQEAGSADPSWLAYTLLAHPRACCSPLP